MLTLSKSLESRIGATWYFVHTYSSSLLFYDFRRTTGIRIHAAAPRNIANVDRSPARLPS